MILIEVNQVDAAVLPLSQFKQHLRLGTGFAEDSAQDDVLEGYIRAALAAIEGRTGQAIFQRDFIWTVQSWANPEGQAFPLAPVRSIQQVTLVDKAGARLSEDAGGFTFVEDSFEPKFRALQGTLPEPPKDGKVEVLLTAGAALDWSQVPPDLAQAILLMASHYYEYRNDVALGKGCTPFGVTALLERYRPMRIGFGGRS
ncbi:head-tail connector protein [Oceanicola sp. S124]|uniref:head-tail connector protein n=1 Tax=Oceanicola sp. S124 TaxID=1042378 RepID=UPI00025596A7|nr:phage head-tail connector protein [Oceanicola sp. S124]